MEAYKLFKERVGVSGNCFKLHSKIAHYWLSSLFYFVFLQHLEWNSDQSLDETKLTAIYRRHFVEFHTWIHCSCCCLCSVCPNIFSKKNLLERPHIISNANSFFSLKFEILNWTPMSALSVQFLVRFQIQFQINLTELIWFFCIAITTMNGGIENLFVRRKRKTVSCQLMRFFLNHVALSNYSIEN